MSHGAWACNRMSGAQLRQLATTFTAGALLAFLLTSWSARSGFPSLTSHSQSDLAVCDLPKAQGIALSPLALANVTGSASIIPDRLIVAARHHEVSLPLTSAAVRHGIAEACALYGYDNPCQQHWTVLVQDTSWLDTYLSHLPHIGRQGFRCSGPFHCMYGRLQRRNAADSATMHLAVYQVDEPAFTVGAQHATKANKGNEASAYLQASSNVAKTSSV